jgi:LuxR family transcriptional regulator, maltose regulon positive regulatory protein
MTEEAGVAVLPSTRRRGLRETRLLPPRMRRGSVPRTRLLSLMRSARDRSVVSIVAPSGYGKTTVLAQWASRDPRPVAWVTINDGHNDPVVLFTDLATAILRQEPLDPAVFDAIGTPGLSSYQLAGRLLAALADLPAPVLVVIDDAHRLNEPACLDVLSEFVGHLPPGWQVAIGGRDATSVSLARLRGHGLLLEIGAAELAMDEGEAARLLRPLGLTLALDDLETLVASVHGWPALIYLAGLAATRSGEPAIRVATGTDGYVAEYLRSEVLESRPVDQVTLLLGSAILERFNGSLCDAVVGRTGSAAFLTALARSTLLVDEQGGWYRYHSLLRDFLRSELEHRAPGRIPELHRRAALWHDRHGFPDDAIEHSFAAGDVDGAANAVAGVVLRYHWSGRRATVRAWLARFRDEDLEERPWLAVIGAIEEAGVGHVVSAERLADLVERGSFEGRPPDGTASFESGRSILRALMCRAGAEDALAQATRAVQLEPAGSPWRDVALWAQANGRLLAGETEAGDALLEDAVDAARFNRNWGTWQCALAQRALLAIERGDWIVAASHAEAAGEIVASAHLAEYQVTAMTRAALALVAARRGDPHAAREELARSVGLRPQLTASLPWLNAAALVALARAYLAVGDAPGARTVLSQADDVLRLRPDLGVIPDQVAMLRSQIGTLPTGFGGASTLTAAELRVLAYLPLYLSFKEIGQRLGVKASTVQTHAVAIYGKLGASSRSEAVDLAVAAGLLDARPTWFATSHT